jgi:hypothetical protein
LLDQHDPYLGMCRASVAVRATPHHDFDTLLEPLLYNRRDGDALHVLGPIPLQLAGQAVDGQIQVGMYR